MPERDELEPMEKIDTTQARLLRNLVFQPPDRGHKAGLCSSNADI